MTTIIIMILLMIMIFLRNRRDIFLLYYVKKKRRANALVTTRISGSNLRPAFRSHSVYASRRSMADGLPLILLLLPGKYTAFLLLASWKLPGAAVHIFLFSFHHISFPLSLPESSPFILTVALFFVRSLSHSFCILALRKRNLTTIILFGDIFIQ